MGNPHCITYVEKITDELVLGVGPKVEVDPAFPRRTNVEFVKVNRPDDVTLRVWERGSGETLACGTGACAAVVAGIRLGLLDARVDVDARGGRLTVEWHGGTSHVLMTGPAQTVFEGVIEL